MEWWVPGVIVFALLFVLFAIGAPVAVVLGLTGIVGLFVWVGGTTGLFVIASLAYSKSFSFLLIAVPLFLLMAELFIHSGLLSDVFDAAHKWMGSLPGGLASASIASCAIFAAITGSSMVNTATIGSAAIPEMLKRGYDKSLATGAICGGGTLGILIPPSTIMIVFGDLAQVSVPRLFMAGVVPGIVITILFISYITIVTKLNPKLGPPTEAISLKEKLHASRRIWIVVLFIVVVLVMLYTGVATPTETAALGAFLALVLALAFGKLTWSNLQEALIRTIRTTSMLFLVMIGASVFTVLLGHLQIPQRLTAMVISLTTSPWMIMIVMQIVIMILGCFLDPFGIMFITTPVFLPIVVGLGFDPIWYGILFVINMEMANVTPPVGFNLFVLKGIAPPEVSMNDIIIGSLPFVGVLALGLAVIMVFPPLALWLPSTMR